MFSKAIVYSIIYEDGQHDKDSLSGLAFSKWKYPSEEDDVPLTDPNDIIALSMVNRLMVFILDPSRAVAESVIVYIMIQVVTTTYGL